MLCNHVDLGSIPSSCIKEPGVLECGHNPNTGAAETGRFLVCWSATLEKLVNFGL